MAGEQMPENMTFEEALAWAQRRGVMLPAEYQELRQDEARARAFTVSGMAALGQIQAVLDLVNEAVGNGMTFDQWRKALPEEALRLPKSRAETIFRTAIQNAYNAGRWDQQRVGLADRPYLMYDAVNDDRTRERHRKMDGFIAGADDPIWKQWYPPNGFNCRCTVISLTRDQAIARGLLKQQHPNVQPDQGFDYNPGQAYDEKLRDLTTSTLRSVDPVLRPVGREKLDEAEAIRQGRDRRRSPPA